MRKVKPLPFGQTAEYSGYHLKLLVGCLTLWKVNMDVPIDLIRLWRSIRLLHERAQLTLERRARNVGLVVAGIANNRLVNTTDLQTGSGTPNVQTSQQLDLGAEEDTSVEGNDSFRHMINPFCASLGDLEQSSR